MTLKICIFDNYDSFTYNLYHVLSTVRKKAEYVIIRNKDRTVFDLDFNVLIISPGPMGPEQTGCLTELFETRIIPERIPVFGVCLGMQFLGAFYGATIVPAVYPVHGRMMMINHDGEDLFRGIKKQMGVMRYNSLEVTNIEQKPIRVLAREQATGMIMALRHKDFPFAGVQFHPESFLSCYSHKLINNFFKIYVEH
ncbi:MAG: aminodeoxychorismate/anthranilate synthase component II [Spirochaetales bacterium]|nr:aminodeoxychorismate/anthranilate synthase component II [Spirochaetales bacterium]